ncbi:hypothetical protein [Lactococcus termiticola]|uniref:YvbJ-like NTF2-like domain-containing protein n=1 Tax=Lactococcus termiticola TaxID=2169526 RepID=A0A2R5HEM4_9LACT|nr:hypothetical protein [Lactococcus termiticola]GBG96482.1 hypothetical protein NtB2_00594 [Lactococcus termiticola]
MQTKKIKQIAGIIVAVAFFLGLIGLYSYYSRKSSAAHAIQGIEKAIQSRDYQAFSQFVPTFSNGKKISRLEFEAFVTAERQAKSGEVEQLIKSEAFKEKDRGFFSSKQYLPQDRKIRLTSQEEGTKISFLQGKDQLTKPAETGASVGDFIPANYPLTYQVASDAFGKFEEKASIDLTTEDGNLDVQEKQGFLEAEKTQKGFLQLMVNYYTSWADCVNGNFNFGAIKSATAALIAGEKDSWKEIIPELASYQESFQHFVINTDSLKFSDDSTDKETVIYDVYFDDSLTLKSKTGKSASDNRKNVTVTAVFNPEQKSWQIDELDFEVSAEEPKDGAHQQKTSLDSPEEIVWRADQQNKL